MGFVSSMTGFGKSENSNDKIKFLVELKTINNRYHDINIKLPKYIRGFEEPIRKTLKDKISRGRVDITVTYDILAGNDANIVINESVAKGYYQAIQTLSDMMGVKQEVSIDTLIKLPDIMEINKSDGDNDDNWAVLQKALLDGLEALNKMRMAEGQELKEDILVGCDQIEQLTSTIENDASSVAKEQKEKLNKRIQELLEQPYQLDENKLYNEIVFYADRSDIHEEIVRLRSHIKQLTKTLKQGGAIGRKLDFILQEMNREANTIGSKSSKITITQNVVEIKNHIEKIREQVQNIE